MSVRSRHMEGKVLKLIKIVTGDEIADCLTKALPEPGIRAARRVLCG